MSTGPISPTGKSNQGAAKGQAAPIKQVVPSDQGDTGEAKKARESQRSADAQAIREGVDAKRSTEEGQKNSENYDVNISKQAFERAQAYKKALEIARGTPDIREDKVAHLKEQIQNGTYNIDSGKIADGMLREAIKDHLATTMD